MIASPRSFHEFLLHVALGGGAADVVALSEYGERPPPVRSVFVSALLNAVPSRSPLSTPQRSLRRVKIQEADAKTLLVAQGLPVPDWEVARTPDEARAAAEGRHAAGTRGTSATRRS